MSRTLGNCVEAAGIKTSVFWWFSVFRLSGEFTARLVPVGGPVASIPAGGARPLQAPPVPPIPQPVCRRTQAASSPVTEVDCSSFRTRVACVLAPTLW